MRVQHRRPGASVTPASSPQLEDAPAVAAIARRIDAELREAMSKLVRHATELAVAGVEAMVGRDPQLARCALEAALREAVSSLVGAVKLRILVHPSQLAAAKELTAQLAQCLQVSVEADEHISPGGCLVSSDLGQVDATMEGRLQRLREVLQEEVHL